MLRESVFCFKVTCLKYIHGVWFIKTSYLSVLWYLALNKYKSVHKYSIKILNWSFLVMSTCLLCIYTKVYLVSKIFHEVK